MTVNNPPFVTVIMPVRNEGAYIRQSLGAVIAQDYPAERMEVLVADGMSSDETREIVKELASQHANLQLIDNAGKIVPTGMNAATARARGEIIVRVDGHCDIAPDYVRRCVDHLENEGVDAVGGSIETIEATPRGQLIALAMSSSFGVGGSAFRTLKGQTKLVDTVAFPAYKRSAIERAGPYDEELVRNQDDEYNYRLRKLGAKILLAADVHSRYYSRSSLRRLARQFFQYGYWKVRVMQKHPRQMRARQFAPVLFVASILLLLFLVPLLRPALGALAAIIGGYLVVNLAATLHTVVKHGVRGCALLPVVFTTMHVAYGLGFLAGLLAFWNRWRDRTTRSAQQQTARPDGHLLAGPGQAGPKPCS